MLQWYTVKSIAQRSFGAKYRAKCTTFETMGHRLPLVVCALALFATATAQLDDCELSGLFTGGSLEREMSRAILESPEITVLRNHTVCLSVGRTREKFSSISLVIEYTCTDSSSCPSGGQAIEQFDFGCTNEGEWSYIQFSDVDNGRTTNPMASFDTSLRTDCGACFPVHPDTSDPPTIDPVTHCHGRPHTVLLASEGHNLYFVLAHYRVQRMQ